jgi:predicted Zn-dependent peptidase
MTLPMDNVETALWLEADRMTGLDLDPCKVDVEKMVVVEEMKQRYLNQPYGEQWILVRDMVYKNHHYRWPTIGLSPDHIEGTTMEEVRDFYGRYYTPSNAILSVAADIAPERVFELAEKWFGGIASSPRPHDVWTPEPEQTAARRTEIERPVPATQLTIAFPMAGRRSREYYVADVITDLLAGGTSSRLTRSLIKENKIFSAANAYITGELDPGMMVVTGQLMPGVSLALAEEALWAELEMLISEDVEELELEKVRNKFEANITFGELNVMNKALNLAYYAMWDGLAQMNGEAAIYRSVSVEEIKSVADRLFARKKSNTLVIHAENTSKGLKGVD